MDAESGGEKGDLTRRHSVMYNVSCCVWSPGRGDRSGGVAARPAFFLASGQRHATSSTRRTLARRQQTESVEC